MIFSRFSWFPALAQCAWNCTRNGHKIHQQMPSKSHKNLNHFLLRFACNFGCQNGPKKIPEIDKKRVQKFIEKMIKNGCENRPKMDTKTPSNSYILACPAYSATSRMIRAWADRTQFSIDWLALSCTWAETPCTQSTFLSLSGVSHHATTNCL